MNRRRTAIAAAFACAVAIACASPPGARAQTAPPAPLATLAGVPAVIDFKDRDVYRGDVRLDYNEHPGVPSQSGSIAFDDHERHRRGYVALPNGPGTFTSSNGTTIYDLDFVNGRAQSWGKLVIPSVDAAAGLRFEGLFTDNAAYYGTLAYTDGTSYAGYFDGGCYSGTPAAPRPFPALPGAGTPLGNDIAALPSPDPRGGTYTNAGLVVTATWVHTGDSCASMRATNARVTYPDGDTYLGDLSVAGRYAGFGAYYEKHDAGSAATHPADALLCGTHPDAAAYGPGTYTIVSGRFTPDFSGDAKAVCGASYADVTTMTVSSARTGDRLDGRADVAFANGDRATAPIVDGRLNGAGTYVPHGYPATLSGAFVDGRFGPVALLHDRCDRTYPMIVRDGAIVNDPSRNGGVNYLFNACDRFVAGPGGSVDRRGYATGPGTKILTSGQAIAGTWERGRAYGRLVVRVREPFLATIVIPDVRQEHDRFVGAATVRYANGDVAYGFLDGYTLEGRGAYRYAATRCTAHGTFVRGRLHGAATLSCPNEPQFAGVVGPDGSVQ